MLSLYTLKNRLILYFTIVIIIASIGITIYYANFSRGLLENNVVSNTRNNIDYILSNVEKQITQCRELSDWIFVNRNLDKVLIRDYSDEKYNYDYDLSTAYNLLYDRIYYSSIGKYVISVIIEGVNGVNLKLFQDTYFTDINELKAAPWFQSGVASQRFSFIGIEDNLATEKIYNKFLPFVRTVIFADNRKPIGWQMVSFSPDLISDSLKDFEVPDGDLIFILDKQGRCLYSSDSKYIGTDVSGSLPNIYQGDDTAYSVAEFLGRKKLVLHKESPAADFKIVYLADYSIMDVQFVAVSRISIIIVLIAITISSLLTIFLTTNLTKPLSKVMHRIDRISKGEFHVDPSIEGNDEIGRLGKSTNMLAVNIENLLNKVRDEEQKKKELELEVLQTQINPHFIYNTLNSVKLMAQVQKASGIYETVTALGALLKETSKGAKSQITIQEEIDLLNDYITIQKIRKKGLIQVNYTLDEGIVNCKIPKFTLQPIVENSIMHGFEGIKGIGIINITARFEQNDIVIEVRDNGVGIPPEKLENLLQNNISKGERYFSLGLKNIDERIKHIYGRQYGLTFESRRLEYSLVRIRIARETQL